MSATSVFRCVQHWPGDREWAGIKTFRVDEPGRIVEHWDELQIVPAVSVESNPTA
jgi:predicted SnoaL-like aldol condensation-catalyzing enzyme